MSSRWDAPPASSPPAAAPSDAAAAAAAAAARIAAQYSAAGAGSASSPPRGGASGPPEHDAEFTFDIEINDQRNRYMLTKGQTQQQLLKDTGASVTTKGTWYPDKALATEADPPLYLHIAATSREILDKGIEAVRELMKQELPDLNQDPRVRREMERGAPRETERRKWPEAKIFIDLEPLRNFNVRAKVVGPGGLFVKYIQGETGTRVQIKGQGSGFMDSETGRESDERMHIAVAGPDEAMVQAGKVMAEDLLDAVRTEYGKAHAVLVQQGVWVPPFNGAGNAQPQQQQWQAPGAGANGLPQQPQGQAPPPPEEAAPPPPPEDAAPPPPSEPAPPPPAEPAPVVKKKTPEEEALDKYWMDYKKWEDSFKAYHGRLPSKEDGGQDLPAQYR